MFARILKNPDNLGNFTPAVFEKFKNSMFIIEDDFDELNYIKRKYDANINKKYYTLMILPTYDCNFSCWYCW